jgi:hypothetical protein
LTVEQLLWYFDNGAQEAGALPPEPLGTSFSRVPSDSPIRGTDFASMWRAIEAGYQTQPADCPPVRLLGRYGYAVRCPGRVEARRLSERREERLLGPGHAAFGLADLRGDAWCLSDSGLVASWISGSEFIKVLTGVKVLCPEHLVLYQGPLPNASLLGDGPQALAGMEFFNHRRSRVLDGVRYGVCSINVVFRLPPEGERLLLERGALLAWLFPVLPRTELTLRRLCVEV